MDFFAVPPVHASLSFLCFVTITILNNDRRSRSVAVVSSSKRKPYWYRRVYSQSVFGGCRVIGLR